MYVRDTNLDKDLAERYEIGRIITERGFVDESSRIGKMTTSHRYLILSAQMADFSEFENNTDWDLHTAARNSLFKIIDIYHHRGKTQIALLHLPEGFESVFDRISDIEEKYIKLSRKKFHESFEMEILPELADDL